MKRTGLRRTAPLLPCGPRYASREKAAESGRGEPYECPDRRRCGGWHVRKTEEPTRLTLPAVRRAPGEFTSRVKLLVRTRAGLGSPFDARCEGCGCFLGISGGQFQHRCSRGAGGCRDTVVNGPSGGLLLCGNPLDKSTCHGAAESRSAETERWGLWIRHGTTPAYDPRNVPVFWHRSTYLWLPEDGGPYLTEPPGQVAA